MVSVFIADSDIELINNPEVKPVIVQCESFVRNRLTKINRYILHPLVGNFKFGSNWPTSTELACYHCCHAFITTPIPIVRRYEEGKMLFHCYGMFCSANCAKAYIIENEPGISTRRMYEFNYMIRTVFNVKGPVKPSPPRFRLKMFGGDLDIVQFRTGFTTVSVQLVSPPFVPSYTMFKEVSDEALQETCDHNMFSNRPDAEANSLYNKFLATNPHVAMEDDEEGDKQKPKKKKKSESEKKPPKPRKPSQKKQKRNEDTGVTTEVA